jgi:hypothetical protein
VLDPCIWPYYRTKLTWNGERWDFIGKGYTKSRDHTARDVGLSQYIGHASDGASVYVLLLDRSGNRAPEQQIALMKKVIHVVSFDCDPYKLTKLLTMAVIEIH